MSSYATRNIPVDAIRWTSHDGYDVLRWAGERAAAVGRAMQNRVTLVSGQGVHHLRVETPAGAATANRGDWIVHTDGDAFHVMHDHLFTAIFWRHCRSWFGVSQCAQPEGHGGDWHESINLIRWRDADATPPPGLPGLGVQIRTRDDRPGEAMYFIDGVKTVAVGREPEPGELEAMAEYDREYRRTAIRAARAAGREVWCGGEPCGVCSRCAP